MTSSKLPDEAFQVWFHFVSYKSSTESQWNEIQPCTTRSIKIDKKDKESTQKKYKTAIEKFLIYKQNKMLKFKNFIENIPSKLYHIHKRRGVLRSP